MMNVKGISPLIATVLLIGFTVALAAVVMTWGTGFVRSTTEQTAESSSLGIVCANINYQISNVIFDCNTNTISKIEITNSGDEKIENMILRAKLPTETKPLAVGAVNSIDGISVKTITLNDGNLGAKPEKVIVIAQVKLKSGGELKTCSDAARDFTLSC